MTKMNHQKYRPYPPIDLPDRHWPNAAIAKAPIWCSVDLRDGNQALSVPMSVERKIKMFESLVRVGFKEIEIGFPSASETEYAFARALIEENRVPADVTVQVLVQAREHLIRRTFESLRGCRNAIIHFYNSTSPAQRRWVFNKTKEEVRQIAVDGATLIKTLMEEEKQPGFRVEYSPESFTATEMPFALEICEAVMDVFQPSPARRLILNLPATVEMATPNVYADQIEWFCRHLSRRNGAIISLHTHNDRGTAVAAAELAVMAGADRVEGTLFGNGERTGNLDIVTMAMNLFSRGVDPELDFSNIRELVDVYESCSGMSVHPRHPYAGDLVYTAFSGSHQDAISKGLAAQKPDQPWEVPYLPIDPADVGRQYEPIIRVNSQSGKGGVAYVMQADYGLRIPKPMRPDFAAVIQKIADTRGVELTSAEIKAAFDREYLRPQGPYQLTAFNIVQDDYKTTKEGKGVRHVTVSAAVKVNGKKIAFEEWGNGPIDAFVKGLKKALNVEFKLASYDEHAVNTGSDATAACYIGLEKDGKTVWGVGMDPDIAIASIKAILCAFDRAPR